MDIGITCAQYLSFTDFERPCVPIGKLHERMEYYELVEFAKRARVSHQGKLSRITVVPRAKWQRAAKLPSHGNKPAIVVLWAFRSRIDSIVSDPLAYIIEHNMLHLLDIFLVHTDRGYHGAVSRSGLQPFAVLTGGEDDLAKVLRCVPDREGPGNRFTAHTWRVRVDFSLSRSVQWGGRRSVELLAEAGADLGAETNHHLPAAERLVRKGVNRRQKILHGSSTVEFARALGDGTAAIEQTAPHWYYPLGSCQVCAARVPLGF
jgi:hypothetical protein